MKYLILFLVINFNCKDTMKELDYCKMYKEDQSHLFDSKKTESENAEIKKQRIEIFYSNYNEIKNYSHIEGFPIVKDSMQFTTDSCKFYAMYATLIHICQIDPKLFFSDENIVFLANAIDKNLLDNSLVYTAIKIGSHTPYCVDQKPAITEALIKWKLHEKLSKYIEYKECQK